jgi:hypothetical protein
MAGEIPRERRSKPFWQSGLRPGDAGTSLLMNPIKRKVARKAATTTAKHTARGAASKLRRDPMRAAALLGIGWAAGMLTGRLFARPASPSP